MFLLVMLLLNESKRSSYKTRLKGQIRGSLYFFFIGVQMILHTARLGLANPRYNPMDLLYVFIAIPL